MQQTRRFFGTDGVRGKANQGNMTADVVVKLGMAAGLLFADDERRCRVVIGKDTRLSGYLLEPALTAGFVAAGVDVTLVGPIPTPGIAMLVETMRADLGVMISASHNPYYDNGIKFFGPEGYKLTDEQELAIERYLLQPELLTYATPDKLGRVVRLEDARGRYLERVKQCFPKHLTLKGLKIVIDCAHGAAYTIGPQILKELGAQVVETGTHPNGFNINERCGSTFPERVTQMVSMHHADIGIALDGDADRVLICDEKGQVVGGEQLLALIATYLQDAGTLQGDVIVSTVMANLGLEHYLAHRGLKLLRTAVGDRYVMEAMRQCGGNLGGEPSGHIILSHLTMGGDGLVAALTVLAALRESGKKASELCHLFEPLPQILKNIRHERVSAISDSLIQKVTAESKAILGDTGRILVRQSGTEPVLRIMVEGQDKQLVTVLADQLAQQFRLHLGEAETRSA